MQILQKHQRSFHALGSVCFPKIKANMSRCRHCISDEIESCGRLRSREFGRKRAVHLASLETNFFRSLSEGHGPCCMSPRNTGCRSSPRDHFNATSSSQVNCILTTTEQTIIMTISRPFPPPCPHDLEETITTLGTSLFRAYLLASMYEFEFCQRLFIGQNRRADILNHIHDTSSPLLKVISWRKLGLELENYCTRIGESSRVDWYLGQMNRSESKRHNTDPLIRAFLVSLGLDPDSKDLISATKEGCRMLAVEKFFHEPTTSLCFAHHLPSRISLCQLRNVLPLIHEDPVCTLIFQTGSQWYLDRIEKYNEWFCEAKTSTTEQAHPRQKTYPSNLSTGKTSRKRQADDIDTGSARRRPRVSHSPGTDSAPREGTTATIVPPSQDSAALPALCGPPTTFSITAPFSSHNAPAATHSTFVPYDDAAEICPNCNVPPATHSAYVPPANHSAYVPVANHSAYVPAANHSAYVPAANHSAYVPPANHSAYVPPANHSAYVPPANHSAYVPVANHSAYVPAANHSAYVPAANHSAYVPAANHSAYVPAATHSAYVPAATHSTSPPHNAVADMNFSPEPYSSDTTRNSNTRDGGTDASLLTSSHPNSFNENSLGACFALSEFSGLCVHRAF